MGFLNFGSVSVLKTSVPVMAYLGRGPVNSLVLSISGNFGTGYGLCSKSGISGNRI